MNVDEQQLRLTLNHLFQSSRGNELYPALLEMLDRNSLMFLLSGAQQTSGSVENQHSTSKTFGVRPKIDSPTGNETAAPAPFLFLVTRSFFPNQFVFHTFAM